MADFEAPSFSLGLDQDFVAPSFSLGLDLDLESDDPGRQEPGFNPPPEPPTGLGSQSFEENEIIQEKTLNPGIEVEDSPPILRRLRRGGRSSQFSTVGKRDSVFISATVDDDIEDFSSDEESRREMHSSVENHSVPSSSKVVLPRCRVLPKQWTSKTKAQKDTPNSNSSAFTSLEASEKKLMFPKLTISPLRRFQLVDSDSDEPSASDAHNREATAADSSNKKRQLNPSPSLTGNQQKKANISSNIFQSEDLWKYFTPKTSTNIPTPALDEFCDEYFVSVKNNNVGPSKEEHVRLGRSGACFPNKNISESIEKDGRPHAFRYFYHDDPRIRRLVRERLPNFSPLGMKGDQFDMRSDAAESVNYKTQFGHRGTPSQTFKEGNKNLKKNPTRGRKNLKNTNAKDTLEVPTNWVNPKRCNNIPKNAGKQRVQANTSAGRWYTNPDGRKVYKTKNGQEMAGRNAYRQFKKDSGAASKKTKKRAPPKKKSKS